MRGNHQHGLSADAQHVEGFFRSRECALAVQPEETAIDRSTIGLPCRREGADELHVALRQDAPAVPHSVLQIEVCDAGPVAARSKFVTMGEEVHVGITVQHHRANTELTEPRPMWYRM